MTRSGSWAAVVLGLSTAISVPVDAADVIYAATSNGVFKTTDGGASWTSSNTGLSGIPVFSLAIAPTTPTTIYAGTFGHRVFKSTDSGGHWVAVSDGFGDDTVLSLAIDPLNPAMIYAGTTTSSSTITVSPFVPGSGVIKSSNSASRWTVGNAGLPRAMVTALVIDPSNPAVVYAGTNVAGVFKTTNRGLTWVAANAGIANSDISHVVVDPRNSSVVYVGMEGCSAGCSSPAGVFKSTNAGTTWVSASVGLEDDLQVVTLAIDPANTAVLYAGTRFNGIFKTTDAGRSWRSSSPAPTGTMFAIVHFSLAVDSSQPDTVYAGTFDGVLKTTDGGKTWLASNSGLPPSTRVFALAVGGGV